MAKQESVDRGIDIVRKTISTVRKSLPKPFRMGAKDKPKKTSEGDGKTAVALGSMMGNYLSGEKKDAIDALKGTDPSKTLWGRVDVIAKYVEEIQKDNEEESEDEEKSFYEKLTEFIEGEGTQQFSKDFCKLIEGVGSIVEYINEGEEDEASQEESEAEKLIVDVTGTGDNALSSLVETIKENPNVAEDSKKSLEGVSDVVKTAEKAIEDMEKAGENPGAIDKYKAAMEKVEEANDKTKEVTDKADPKEAAKQKKAFDGLGEVMIGVAAMALVLLAVGLLADKINFGGLIQFAISLGVFLLLVGLALRVAWDNMKLDQESVKAALMLVAGGALVMFLGGAIMDLVDMGNLVLFTVTLGGFLIAIGYALRKARLKRTGKQSLYAIAVVAGAALIMFLGAAIVPLVDTKSLAKFTILLGGFLFAIGKVLKWVGKAFNRMTKQAIWALAVVAGAALIMFLGGAIMDLVNVGQLILFTVTLSAFMLAIAGVLFFVGKVFNKVKQEALYALALVAGSALIMFLGAAVMDLIDIGNLVLFTVTLTLFLGAITLVFLLGKNAYKEGLKGAKDAAILVVAAGATLLIGGLVMKYIEPGNIILFTVLLDLLLLGVSLSFLIIKNVHEMEEKALGMLAVIGIGGLMMLAGGLILSKFPELLINVPLFTILLAIMLGGIALTMAILGAFQSAIMQGMVIALVISDIIALGALSMLGISLALRIAGGPVPLLIGVAAFIGAFVIMGLAIAGLGFLAGFIIAGAAAMVAMTGAIMVGCVGLIMVAQVMKILSKVPKLDPKILIGNVTAIMGVVGILAPLALFSGPLVAIAATIFLLAKAISAMAEAVGDIAQLKIPIEWNQAGRPTKYRELKQADFKNAGKNTGLIVSTLTTGIMEVYDKHPEWYAGSGLFSSSPLEKVIKQSAKLQELLSAIAQGVKAWAQLQVPDKWDPKTGRPVHFRDMKITEPKNAAKNVVAVITTISNGIMKLWEEHPDWYKDSLFSNSPLVKVIKQNMKIQELMSSIAQGVKAWATMQVPDQWDSKTGRPTHFRELKPNEPKLAAKNVVDVIKCITQGIMKLYEDHPDWYKETEGGFIGMGKKSPLAKVINQNIKLQELMSAIAQGVKAWALLQVPDQWDPKTGRPVHFRDLKENEPTDAAANVVKVVSILSEGIMKLYEEHTDWFTEVGGNWLKSGTSPLQKVIKQTVTLNELLSGIAQGVKAWALLQVPDEWDPKTGRPIHFRDLKENEPTDAATNTATIVGILFGALEEVYNGHEDWFQEEGGFLGIGGSSKLAKVIKQTLKLSELLSGIAQGVKAWALMQIPDDWDPKTGRPIHFRDLKENEATDAADNVQYIITTLGNAVMSSYQDHKDWFEDKSIFGKLGFDLGGTPFSKAINVNLKLTTLITGIAEGLQKFAQLQMPIEWNQEGKPIKFKKMTSDDIEEATTNIKDIITTLGDAIMGSYEEHTDWYEDKSIFGKLGVDFGATPFSRAVSANVKLGDLITNIAKGLQGFAQLLVPTKWNDEGKPIEFEKMSGDDIKEAGQHVSDIVTELGKAIMDVYDKNTEWFESTSLFGKIFGSIEDTPFVRVVSINLRLSELITNIGKGMQEMAKLQMPDQWDEEGKPIHFVKLGPKDFINAGQNIGDVIKFLGQTMMQTYKANPDWYAIKTDDDGNVIEGSQPIQLAINGNHKMGELIKNMAEGIKAYSELNFAGVTDDMTEQQKAQIAKNTFQEAATNIKTVCTTVGEALMNIANDPKYGKWFKEIMETTVIKHTFGKDDVQTKGTGRTPFGNIVGSMSKMGDLISGISEAIAMYASMQIPGPDGNMIPLPEGTFEKAANEIKNVIITIGKAIMSVYEENPKMFGVEVCSVFFGSSSVPSENNPFAVTVASLSKMSEMISSLSEGLTAYASQRVPIAWDKDGKPTEYQPLTSADMSAAATQIGMIVSTLGMAIGDAYNSSPEAFETDFDGGSPAANVSKSLSKLIPFIGQVGGILGRYAKGEVLLWDGHSRDSDGFKVYEPFPLGTREIDEATQKIGQIMVAIGQTIADVYEDNPRVFMWGDDSPGVAIAKSLDIMGPAIGNAATYIGEFNKKYLEYGLDSTNIKEIGEQMTNIISNITKIYVLIAAHKFHWYREFGIQFGNAEWTFQGIMDQFSSTWGPQTGRLNLAIDNVGVMMDNIIYFAKKYFTGDRKTLFMSYANDSISIINGITALVLSIGSLMQTLHNLNEGKKSSAGLRLLGMEKVEVLGLKDFIDEADEIMYNVEMSSKVISEFADNMMYLIPKIFALNAVTGGDPGAMLEPIMELIYTFRYATQALSSEFGSLGSPFSGMSFFKSISNAEVEPKDLLNKVKLLSASLHTIAQVAIESATVNPKGFDILANGIQNINSAISSIKNTAVFANQTRQLGKYVKAINNVKLDNLKALQQFITSVNKLASKMGNIDKLTEALGNKLAIQLKHLTAQLIEAKKTIDKAEQIQEKRHRAIEDSIKKIDDLMKNHMVVDIKVDSDLKSNK